MTLRLRPEEASAWYEARQPGLGEAFVEEVGAALDRIEDGPLRYPAAHGPLRRALLRRFPFSVYFEAEGTSVIVVAILHQRRSKESWRLKGSNKRR